MEPTQRCGLGEGVARGVAEPLLHCNAAGALLSERGSGRPSRALRAVLGGPDGGGTPHEWRLGRRPAPCLRLSDDSSSLTFSISSRSALDAASKPLIPFLRWAGSKRKILPKLREFWRPDYRRYVEPFTGSSALFFCVTPERALLADLNESLIETYTVVRDRPDDVHRALLALPVGKRAYYRIRAQVPSRLGPFSRAVRFLYLNRFCFNGIYRTNASGGFNVPFAGGGVIPSITQLRQCSRLLEGATLKAQDFGKTLSSTRDGDFVYLDPPYAVESRRVFREYDAKRFQRKDLERLGRHLPRNA